MSPDEWLQILSHPCTSDLTALTVSDRSLLGALPAELTAQLALLTRLESISFYKQPTSSDFFAVLPTLPALSALDMIMREMDDSSDGAKASLLKALTACTRLTHLGLSVPSDESGSDQLFRHIFCDSAAAGAGEAHAFLSRLQRLHLGRFDLTPLRSEELTAAFTSLTSLRQLTLDSSERVDDLLPSIALVTSLVDLTIWACDSCEMDESGIDHMRSTTPSIDPLRAFMQVRSPAAITLHVPRAFKPWRHDFDALDSDRFRLRMQ